MTQFTEDWTFGRVDKWPVAHLKDKPGVIAVEIGCFEGRTTKWILENVLTGDGSKIYCIDPFAGLAYYGRDPGNYYERFRHNTGAYESKIVLLRGHSQIVLRDMLHVHAPYESVDLAYVDGDHGTENTIEDAILIWRFIKPGGIVIFDDYQWAYAPHEYERPAIAIDAFLKLYVRQIENVYMDWQVIVQKAGGKEPVIPKPIKIKAKITETQNREGGLLKYVGSGNWISGVPARDLSDDEAEQYGRARLVASKLYVDTGKPWDANEAYPRSAPTMTTARKSDRHANSEKGKQGEQGKG